MSKEKIDWHFKALNNVEFALFISFEAKNKMFDKILVGTLDKGKIKIDTENKAKLDAIVSIDVPNNYYRYIHEIMERQLKPIYAELDADGIKVKTAFPAKIYFNKVVNSDHWNVNINYEGLYNDIRP